VSLDRYEDSCCESMNTVEMVQPQDHSSGTERADELVTKKHNRSSSSDQAKPRPGFSNDVVQSVEYAPAPTSPNKHTKGASNRPSTKRRKSSTSSNKHKSRPTYSRKYSTPPSRPLSPAGYPHLFEPDMVIPEIDLNATSLGSHFPNHQEQTLQVDTAPQEPDLWSEPDPDTDYFSTIEGPGPRHIRGKSRRQLSQNASQVISLNTLMAGSGNANALQQINEDVEADFLLPPTPGAFVP